MEDRRSGDVSPLLVPRADHFILKNAFNLANKHDQIIEMNHVHPILMPPLSGLYRWLRRHYLGLTPPG